jgi:hypothetical protein
MNLGLVVETESAFGARHKSFAVAGAGLLNLVRANGQDTAQPGGIGDQWSVKGFHQAS